MRRSPRLNAGVRGADHRDARFQRSRLAALSVAGAGALALAAAGLARAAAPPPAVQPPAAAPALPAAGQPAAPGLGSSNNPVDITSEGLEVIQPQHVYIFKGNVEAVQDQARLRTPELRVYTKDKPQTPGAKPAAEVAPGAPQMGAIDHMEAEGPVYYITPTENARGDHGFYQADTDTITLTGNVVLVQGKSVGKGDKLVINRKTGESNLIAANPKTPTGRVRVILYPNQQQNGAQPAAANGKPS